MNRYPKPIIICITVILAIAITLTFLPVGTQPTSSKGFGDSQSEPYYHSYEEMQDWCGAEVDGIWDMGARIRQALQGKT